MASSLRWPLLCVWLHTSDSSSSGNGSRSCRSSAAARKSVAIVCLGGYGREGRMPFKPFKGHWRDYDRAISRMQVHAVDERLEEGGINSEKDERAQLNAFRYTGRCKDGRSTAAIRVFQLQHLRGMLEILTESFSDLLWGPLTYRPLLEKIVRNGLAESWKLFPKNVMLVAFFQPDSEDGKLNSEELAGSVEVNFKSAKLTRPLPPSDAPYLCNMAVKASLRRKGIGGHLLKASEKLAVSMGCKELYLHCRLIDKVPLEMYQRAGYKIVATGSIFSFLVLQRRKHLMKKTLQPQEQE